jgi:beta-lactam-binding protein with PASTA domain
MKRNVVILVVGVAIILFWAITTRDLAISNKRKSEQLQAQVDSLQSENFVLKTQMGSYELSEEHLKETNPKAAKEFTNYLQNETE